MLSLVLLFFLASNDVLAINRTEIVNTTKGPVRGEILTTVFQKVEYSSFNAIPYGKPPVGNLRFRPPIEIDNWTKPLEAVGPTRGCPQIDGNYLGDEDCLYLNIYTPKTNFNSSDNSRAVMVWIHGGSFIGGDANSSYYGPDLLIENDVVVAYISYRLGALGFLSLNLPNATGNAGLKDQVMALKWIQRNIQYFGGDPKKITIFGQSAGAVSAELLSISPMARGLYNRSIAMSGSPLNYWGFSPTNVAVERARSLGLQLKLNSTTNEQLLKELYKVPARDIVMATSKMIQLDLPFKPTIENASISNQVFLSECPEKKYKNREFNDLPHILGFVNAEVAGLVPVNFITFPKTATQPEIEEMNKIVNLTRSYVRNLSIPEPDVFDRYYEIMNNEMYRLTDDADDQWAELLSDCAAIATDIFFILGIDRTQQYRAKATAPVYYYRNSFTYKQLPHMMEGNTLPGVTHADDLAQIFWMVDKRQPFNPNSDIGIQRKKMTKMWTNFAKYGNPTPNGTADPLLNITWAISGMRGIHLEIGHNFSMQPRPIDDFVKIAEVIGEPFEAIPGGCT